jgi:hypothetical protein
MDRVQQGSSLPTGHHSDQHRLLDIDQLIIGRTGATGEKDPVLLHPSLPDLDHQDQGKDPQLVCTSLLTT